MAFVTKTWKDRLVEYAGRRKLKNVATGEEVLMDVSRSEGTVSQAGDAFSAANMNNLEQRIKNEFDTVNSSLRDSSSGESFNFGSLNGVRGFFTDPSKADDSFIPFKSGNDVKVISLSGTGRVSKNIDFSYLANYSALTNDAFAVCPTGIQNYGSSPNTSLTISTSYNAKTGILTVTANEADEFRFNVNNVCVYVK